jgi:hypothetical protein
MALARAYKIGVFIASSLVVAAGAGIAYASIPGPDGVIHGCYKNSNPAQGALITVDSAASCPSGYTALNWNQTGLQGPAGPSTAGSSGLDIGTYTGGGSAFGYGNNLAVCPSDHAHALGGGVDAGGTSGFAITQDEPAIFNYSTGAVTLGSSGTGSVPNAWWSQTVGGGDNGGMAYVICSK